MLLEHIFQLNLIWKESSSLAQRPLRDVNRSVVSGNKRGICFRSALESRMNMLNQTLPFSIFLRPNFREKDIFSTSFSILAEILFLTERCWEFFLPALFKASPFSGKPNKKQAPTAVPYPTPPQLYQGQESFFRPWIALQQCHQILPYLANSQGKHMGSMCRDLGRGLLFS